MTRADKRRNGALSRTAALGVADRIRSLRLRLDRSPEQFASLLGVSQKTIEAWELGRGIERDDLVLVADRTGASLHWLIAGLTLARVEAIRVRAVRSLAPVYCANRAGRPDAVGSFASSAV